MKIKESISQIFCPDGIKCIVCGYELFEDGLYLCKDCTLEQNDNFCTACGRYIPDMGSFCDQCKERPVIFTMARSPYRYKGNVKRLIRKLKYGGAKYLAKIFASYLLECFNQNKWMVDCVTFVPMHAKRHRSRGYNQAELIASEFCKLSGLPLEDYFDRTSYTKNFARMTRSQREKSIKGTIKVKDQVSPQKSVLIIDDVFTTGTTLNYCADLLKNKGSIAVYCLTVASSGVLPSLY